MSQVVEHLADLTGFRDRDLLDSMLVSTLRDLLRPDEMAIYRVVGEAGDQRWLTGARIGALDINVLADPLWTDIESLPRVATAPERALCLEQRRVVERTGAPVMTMFPLGADTDSPAVLEVGTPQGLSAEQVRLVEGVLRIVGNVQSLLDYSERDTLTGLLNRKTFDERFLRLVMDVTDAPTPGVGERRQAALSHAFVGIIDIDHFKRVNDGFGHLIGDEVLLLMSRLMRASFRFYDHLFRFGGEEFVILLRCARPDDAVTAFERLRGRVEQHAFPQVGRVTLSAGLTQVRPGDTPTAAFERADKAVYWAKQNGRNRVADHGMLVGSGALADEARSSDVELF